MSGKEKQVLTDKSGEPCASQPLAIPSMDLPRNGNSSGSSQTAGATGDGGVAEMMGRLNLTAQEAEAFVLEDVEEDPDCPKWALIGKVMAPNTYHISTIKSALRPAWGNPSGLVFHHMGANMFLAEFAKEADRTRVQNGAPWSVSNHCVILNVFDPRVNPADVLFDKLAVWARVLHLPFSLMNDQRGKSFVSRLGKVEKMDVDDKGRAWGEYLRVRVLINVNEPLMRYLSVFSQSRQETDHYAVMYERMPTFCFSCGLIGHSSLSCPTPAERDEYGFLPYHGPKLCVLDERKKKLSGTNSGQHSSSGHGSWSGAGRMGQSYQAPGASDRQGCDKDGGELKSSSKAKNPRARKPKTSTATDSKKGTGTDAAGQRISGQKRKEYRPRATVAVAPLLLLPNATSTVLPTVPEATGDGGDNVVAVFESNKKHKSASLGGDNRSADQAEAIKQPRQTQ
ncbi:hypothetical protein QYE76_062446 [Lolium multiflorum]|uniref:CCHC-type domain-containing protein n=1 Tax=Lolium multiflorum TaxID=4521 RepID=A0AAD8W5N7_LOLMU|nr:hypothetical protein QYE76_062446 [Lolium multiflorum]